MKMYILIPRDWVPPGIAITAAAHASLACYLKFEHHPDTIEWLSGPFKKVVCRVSPEDFRYAKSFGDHVVITESRLDGREVALAFRPRHDWHEFFSGLDLYQ